MTAGDGKLGITWTAAPGATQYRAQISTTSGFTTDLATVTTASLSAVIDAVNGTTYYVRVIAMKAGAPPATPTVAAGTYTPVAAARLANPSIVSIIGIDGAIVVKVYKAADQQRTLVEMSVSPYFDSIAGQKESDQDTITVPAVNGTDYFVRITGKADLIRSSYTVHSRKTKYKGFNTWTPHVVSSKMSEPIISQVFLLPANAAKVEVMPGDVRSNSITAELFTNAAFSGSPAFTTTDTVDNLLFTGLTAGVPYRLRIKENGAGYVSSDWVYFPHFVLPGANIGLARGAGIGDSNMRGNPYCTVGNNAPNRASLLLSSEYGTVDIDKILNIGVGGSGVLNHLENESTTPGVGFPNNSQYNNAITRNGLAIQYGTNDCTVLGFTLDQFIANYVHICEVVNTQGYKTLHITPPIPYGGGEFPNVLPNYRAMAEWLKGNFKSVCGGHAYASCQDDEILHMWTAAYDGTVWRGDKLHGYNPYYQILGENNMAPMFNAFGSMIITKPPTLTGMSFAGGNLTVTIPAGFVASDCQYCLDWDGAVGVNSTWVAMTNNVIAISTTQVAGSVCVRIAATRMTIPGDALLNAGQIN